MKWVLFLIAILFGPLAQGQLHSTYSLDGIAYETAGRVRFKSQIILRSDSSFLWVSVSYRYRSDSIISSYTTIGRWIFDGKILKLDHNPELIDPQKKYDEYEVTKRKLKRIAFKNRFTIRRGDNWATYRATKT
jgi:hypothetical protein